jgi:hypothetical protein
VTSIVTLVREINFFFVGPGPNADYDFLINEVSKPHTTTHPVGRTPLDE